MKDVILVGGEWVSQLLFDATELRNIAYALGLRDLGAQEMLEIADELDRRNGVDL